MPATFKAMTTFDRNVFKTRWKKINESPIKRAGLLVRKIARRSIRSRKKDTPSPAGQPPRSRAPGAPMKKIFSVPSRWATQAVVGPVALSSDANPTPAIHEHGLSALRLVKQETQEFVHAKTKKTSGKYAKRRTVTGWSKRMVKYPERPFMQPALAAAAPKLPALWKDSVK